MSQRPQWNASIVREMMLNPAYAGVGPYPRDAEREGVWVGAVAELMRREGAVTTLKRLRRVVLDTFGGPDALRANTRWAQEIAVRVTELGEEAVLRTWLDELRPALRHLPADAVPELYGFQRLSSADLTDSPTTTRHVVVMDTVDEAEAGELVEEDDVDFDDERPDWGPDVLDAVCGAIELQSGIGNPEYRYFRPDETAWGAHFVEVAPALFRFERDGVTEGEPMPDAIRHFDVSAALSAFDDDEEAPTASFGTEDDGRHVVALAGKVDGEELIVHVYASPFPDAEPSFEFPLRSARTDDPPLSV